MILASAAILAFAFAPNHEGAIKTADSSLAKLQEATEDKWEDYIYSLQESEQQRADNYLNRLVTRLDPSFEPQSEPMFISTDMVTHYPFAGTLAEAKRILASRQSLVVFTLKPDAKNLTKQWDDFTTMPGPNLQAPARFRPHIEAINIVPPCCNYSSLRDQRVHIVWPEPTGHDMNIQFLIDRTTIPPEAASRPSGVNFQTYWETKQEKGGFLALDWIEMIDPDQLLVKRLRAGPQFLPAVQPFWDQISGLSIQQARDRLRADLAAQHSKIALFGLSIDSDSTVSVVPWVLCSFLLFLVAHLRQFRRYGLTDGKSEGVWIGMFDDWTGSAITLVTILLLPFIADVLLVLRFDVRQTSWQVRWLPAGVLACMGLWCSIELYRLRRLIKAEFAKGDSAAPLNQGKGQADPPDDEEDNDDIGLDDSAVTD